MCVCPTPYSESVAYTSPVIHNVSQNNRENVDPLDDANTTAKTSYDSSSTNNDDTSTTGNTTSNTTSTTYNTSITSTNTSGSSTDDTSTSDNGDSKTTVSYDTS